MKFCSYGWAYKFKGERSGLCYQAYWIHMTLRPLLYDESFIECAHLIKYAITSLKDSMR